MRRSFLLLLVAVAVLTAGCPDGDCPTKIAGVFTKSFVVEADDLIPLWASYEADRASCEDGNQIGQVIWDEDDSRRGAVVQNSSGDWMVHVNVDEYETGGIVLGWLECRYVTLLGDDLDDDETACSEAGGTP